MILDKIQSLGHYVITSLTNSMSRSHNQPVVDFLGLHSVNVELRIDMRINLLK